MRRLVLATSLLAFGCTESAIHELALPEGDVSLFTGDLQRYVGVRCGSLDCHGDMGRAMRVYAVDGLRITPDLRGLPISDGEIAVNVEVFESFAYETTEATKNQILLKALSTDAGGQAHEGNTIWLDTQDLGYRCLLGYFLREPEADACEQAFTQGI